MTQKAGGYYARVNSMGTYDYGITNTPQYWAGGYGDLWNLGWRVDHFTFGRPVNTHVGTAATMDEALRLAKISAGYEAD
jgi:hypothetical protein